MIRSRAFDRFSLALILGLAVAPSAGALGVGDLVGIADDGSVYQVDLDAETKQLLGTAPSGYSDVAAEPSGSLLVAGLAGVQRLDPDTGVFTPLSAEATEDIDVATNGRIFVSSGSTVYELDAVTGVRTPLYVSPQMLTGVAADVPGAVITLRDVPVSDPGQPNVFQERQVLSIDVATSAVTVLSSTVSGSDDGFFSSYFAYPYGVDATPDGVVFASYHFTSTAGDGEVIESVTAGTPSYGASELFPPLGFVVDGSGRLILAIPGEDVPNETLRITHAGGSDTTEGFDFFGPYPAYPSTFLDFAIVPVPEPGAIGLVALGLVALAVRRPAR